MIKIYYKNKAINRLQSLVFAEELKTDGKSGKIYEILKRRRSILLYNKIIFFYNFGSKKEASLFLI